MYSYSEAKMSYKDSYSACILFPNILTMVMNMDNWEFHFHHSIEDIVGWYGIFKEPTKILVCIRDNFYPIMIDPWWSIWCRILVYPCPNHEWIIYWRHCGMIWRPSRIHLKFWFCIGDNSCLIMIDAWRRFWCRILIEPWPNHGCSIQSKSND